MDPLSQLEDLYGRMLEITRVQAACLEQGDVAGLTDSLSRKSELVARAEPLMALVRDSDERDSAWFRDGLQRLGSVLAQIVKLEERCRSLAPEARRTAPGRVLAAYSKS